MLISLAQAVQCRLLSAAKNAKGAIEKGCLDAFFANILGCKYLMYAGSYRGGVVGGGERAFCVFCGAVGIAKSGRLALAQNRLITCWKPAGFLPLSRR